MKPTAFRIFDFKSITDSHLCELSGDNISVLAGQNESGKTSILTALRDFDLPEGSTPSTPDFRPDSNFDANPRVSVRFAIDANELNSWLTEANRIIPAPVFEKIKTDGFIWITRQFKTASFHLNDDLAKLWPPTSESDVLSAAEDSDESSNDETSTDNETSTAEEASEGVKSLSATELATFLRDWWPTFVYFDTFQDTLPRSVYYNHIVSEQNTSKQNTTSRKASSEKIPQPVSDFITLSEIDLKKVEEFAKEDKLLGNYLTSRNARITGDFLTYWKQKVDGEETLTLKVKHRRDADGDLELAFYVQDNEVDQYPEQRSKGFLWFLSFYLRLAASHVRDPDRSRLLLVDEPGSYLHARAQRDVLHLFEDRLAKKDQIIYSTHSHFLLPASKLHRLRIVLRIPAGSVVLDRLTHPLLQDNQFRDTMSPILTAIGLDVREVLSFAKEKNILVEGISDYYYLTAWNDILGRKLTEEFNIFPTMGAMSIPMYASLFIGWGLKFVSVLDRDANGEAAKETLERKLAIPSKKIVQPQNALGIEDLFSFEDFKAVLKSLDEKLTINTGETPSNSIKRQKVDKVLLARTYAEDVSNGKRNLTAKSKEGIERLIDDIVKAWEATREINRQAAVK